MIVLDVAASADMVAKIAEAAVDFVAENLMSYALWTFCTYAAVVGAMFVDLITGIAKSHRLGRRCNSHGLKRTCEKAMKYFLPMMCLTCIDLLGSVIFPVPCLTMLFAAYCMICELVSVLESTHTKAEIGRMLEFGEKIIRNS